MNYPLPHRIPGKSLNSVVNSPSSVPDQSLLRIVLHGLRQLDVTPAGRPASTDTALFDSCSVLPVDVDARRAHSLLARHCDHGPQCVPLAWAHNVLDMDGHIQDPTLQCWCVQAPRPRPALPHRGHDRDPATTPSALVDTPLSFGDPRETDVGGEAPLALPSGTGVRGSR